MKKNRVSVNQKRESVKEDQSRVQEAKIDRPRLEKKGVDAVFSEEADLTSKVTSIAKVDKQKSSALDKSELIKTTAYLTPESMTIIEDLQLKLKRSEKRRVTKNELFNKAIALLAKHYKI